ncbi:acyl CoA:acetate/3-ketoacid CoA transferase [Streptomyces sp. HNM0575]|uniref:acyl CoA:acetate/3-ketoacid CoA transferase n=1 Tax=Streptomyces sp. HNM0575 TaxID=2716338 RepID=UPI00145F30A7|nr:CoA-transferase [Streptomyces sp. HNM0575]NLU71416.1 acyl CoA:acetate/3-ketoacid CoA transferase [Streptomyces sp. HNM0575]
MSAAAAAETVPDGATIAMSGSGGGILEADDVLAAVEERFLDSGHPRDLTVIHGLGIGDGRKTGLTRLAHEGMVTRVIGGHWSWSPAMQALAAEGTIEAYSLPAGIIAALLRESGARRPGVFSQVGLGTFVDPRRQGGRLNEVSRDDLVTLVEIDGVEYLHYRPVHVDIGLVRGSSMDEKGNVSFAGEAASLDSQAVAAAARGCGGKVIAQVKRRVPAGGQDPRMVSVPGPLVDIAVLSPGQWQTYAAEFDPAFVQPGTAGHPQQTRRAVTAGPRDVVARRAALEVPRGCVLNVGYGMSAGVVDVLAEEGRLRDVQLAIEQGAVGGVPETGVLFGLSRHPDALVSSLSQFDFFATGMLDVAVLGMAEADQHGNVNVSKVGPSVVGPGGFIDIAHAADKLVFCGTFTAQGLRTDVRPGEMRIVIEGRVRKFVPAVSHVTFDAATARRRGQQALFVTERAVFELRDEGLTLVEVAPGIDVRRDVLDLMDFTPLIDPSLRPMPAEIFKP